MVSDANSQGCAACTTGEEPAPAVGTVETVDGAQVVTVGIVEGYYTPNQFTVKSGEPVKVVFKVEGKPAKACVSKPTFKSLDKTVTVKEGEEVIELGALAPGTYEFSCAMGANKGTITVE
jgi:plastocyanin domain-containing protein